MNSNASVPSDQELARPEWDFALSAVIAPRVRDVSDVLGAVEVDPADPRLLATAGIARKIRVYNLDRCLGGGSPAGCDFYICAPAKLSSLRWRPGSAGRVIGAGDYDGVVTEYDLERRVPVSERDEHGGRRVWSVDYSADGSLAASGADDGAAQVWDARCGAAVGLVDARAPVCSVEFEKERGVHVALGCADKRAYVYDLRNMAGPAAVLDGHRKTVTYVRFAGGGGAVTSSADGSHRMWDTSDGREIRRYKGHSNARSFVGMGVCKGGGLIGSGSESNEVFVYDMRWGDPIWVQGFGDVAEEGGGEKGFVSAVCWREAGENECALVAGGSNGVVKIFVGKRKGEFTI